LNIFKNLHLPIIVFSVLLALISNFGSVIAIIEPITFTKILISNQGLFSTSSLSQTLLNENQIITKLAQQIYFRLERSTAHLD